MRYGIVFRGAFFMFCDSISPSSSCLLHLKNNFHIFRDLGSNLHGTLLEDLCMTVVEDQLLASSDVH